MLHTKMLCKRIIAQFLTIVLLTTNLWSFTSTDALAIALPSTSQLQEEFVEQAHNLSKSAVGEVSKLKNFTVKESAKLAKVAVNEAEKLSDLTVDAVDGSLDLVKHSGLIKLLSNKNLLARAQLVSNMTSGKFCTAYFDSLQGTDGVAWAAIEEGANSVFAIASAISSASAAGAGSLSGYAGIAAVVSNLGLGGVTTTLAGLLGSNVAGAAATSVVTATVGGPVVMGALLAGGAAVGSYGVYELGKFSAERFKGWADTYCTLSAS